MEPFGGAGDAAFGEEGVEGDEQVQVQARVHERQLNRWIASDAQFSCDPCICGNAVAVLRW
ncbi:hypothetical protein Afil01_38300 [Actinorhabdospora filicis]|uniref:Uncharacterized protein n=1 Tax=Actinorhabdospora filicis TaxID=1785913 RepID=A0A9W6SMN0_9ACTN|nr:hypothetical protein Afil01_38300 [Actinorhabdospora filicis]